MPYLNAYLFGYGLIIFILACWGYYDNQKRGNQYFNSTVVFILILVFPIFGFIIYLFLRKSRSL